MDRSFGRTRWIAGAVAGCAAVTAIVAGAQAASAASGTPAARSVVLINCNGQASAKPSGQVLTCADDGDYLSAAHWVSWKGVAFGSATEHIENCYQSCVSPSNHWYSYKVLVTLWRPEARPGHRGQFYFTRLTEIRTGSLKLPHDPNLKQAVTWDLAPWGANGS
jgi:hypothetical protein